MFEVFLAVFLQHRRRERPKVLAKLDASVESLLHLRVAGVGEDAAAAERSRPEFHPSLKPADNEIIMQQLRGAAEYRLRLAPLIFSAELFQRLFNDLVRKGWPDASVVILDRLAWPRGGPVMREESGADRAAAVAGGRVHEEVGKPSLL